MNAERILGALLKQGLRSGRRRRRRSALSGLVPGGLTGAAGLGLLGVAIAAFEHFTQKQPASPQPATGAMPPPPPGPKTSPPPPPPGSPPAPGETQPDEGNSTRGAIVLIRAMIAAANADGQIDAQERQAILEKLDQAGLEAGEREFVERELANPPHLDDLVAQVNSAELAQQVYAASLLAIEVDTEAERQYLQQLQLRLGLDAATVQRLTQQFGQPKEEE